GTACTSASFVGAAKEHRHNRERHDQPEDDREAKCVRPLKAKQEPQHGEPDDEVQEIEKDIREHASRAGDGDIADVVIGHHSVFAVYVDVANRLSRGCPEFAVCRQLRLESNLLTIAVLDYDGLNHSFGVRTAPSLIRIFVAVFETSRRVS